MTSPDEVIYWQCCQIYAGKRRLPQLHFENSCVNCVIYIHLPQHGVYLTSVWLSFCPSIHTLPILLILWGSRGELEPIPADIGREAGDTLDGSPAYRRVHITTKATINTHIHTYGQFPVSPTSVCMSLDRPARENLQTHGEKIQAPHRKTPVEPTSPNPSEKMRLWMWGRLLLSKSLPCLIKSRYIWIFWPPVPPPPPQSVWNKTGFHSLHSPWKPLT